LSWFRINFVEFVGKGTSVVLIVLALAKKKTYHFLCFLCFSSQAQARNCPPNMRAFQLLLVCVLALTVLLPVVHADCTVGTSGTDQYGPPHCDFFGGNDLVGAYDVAYGGSGMLAHSGLVTTAGFTVEVPMDATIQRAMLWWHGWSENGGGACYDCNTERSVTVGFFAQTRVSCCCVSDITLLSLHGDDYLATVFLWECTLSCYGLFAGVYSSFLCLFVVFGWLVGWLLCACVCMYYMHVYS
jgi:hypothetical protein